MKTSGLTRAIWYLKLINFLTFSDYWNLDRVTYLDFQERRCFDSWDARFVSWSTMTVFWLGCQPAALGNKSCRANKTSWVHGWSTRAGLYARIDEWVEALEKVPVLGNNENKKKQLTKNIYPFELRFRKQVSSRGAWNFLLTSAPSS